jgi:hypothetical protein
MISNAVIRYTRTTNSSGYYKPLSSRTAAAALTCAISVLCPTRVLISLIPYLIIVGPEKQYWSANSTQARRVHGHLRSNDMPQPNTRTFFGKPIGSNISGLNIPDLLRDSYIRSRWSFECEACWTHVTDLNPFVQSLMEGEDLHTRLEVTGQVRGRSPAQYGWIRFSLTSV